MATLDQQGAFFLTLLLITQHPGQGMEQGGLAGSRRAQQQDAFAGLDAQLEVADGPGPASGMTPTPALSRDQGSGQIRSPSARPTANRLSTPVAARALVNSQPTTPARMAPDTSRQPR